MGPRTVLVVEDEPIIAFYLQDMLEAAGWTVLGPASSVERALRLLEHETPTVAMLDVNLGQELVTPVAETLKAQGVPFALASSQTRPEQLGGTVLAGVPNVGKPVVEEHVLATLDQLAAAAG